MFATCDSLSSRTKNRVLLPREKDEGSSNVKDLTIRERKKRVSRGEKRGRGEKNVQDYVSCPKTTGPNRHLTNSLRFDLENSFTREIIYILSSRISVIILSIQSEGAERRTGVLEWVIDEHGNGLESLNRQ